MAEEPMPMIPKAESIYVHTGNICAAGGQRQKINQDPSVEVYDCFTHCLNEAISHQDKTSLQYLPSIECVASKCVEPLPQDDQERNELKLTVKVFLTTPTPESLQDALTRVMTSLGVSYVDSLLISYPANTPTKQIQDVWTHVEECTTDASVVNAGVCDMDKEEIETLYNWAQMKPSINQVNLSSCCVMPPDLVEFAAENEIQLLTHNDPQEILSADRLSEMLSNQFTVRDSADWNLQWIIRYTVLVKCRGVIKSKGYMMRALREVRGKRAF